MIGWYITHDDKYYEYKYNHKLIRHIALNIKELYVHEGITSVSLRQTTIEKIHLPVSLRYCMISSNKIKTLDIKNLSNLISLGCSNNPLESLELPDNLKFLYCSFTPLSEIKIPKNLVGFKCFDKIKRHFSFNEKIKIIDVSAHHKITNIEKYLNNDKARITYRG